MPVLDLVQVARQALQHQQQAQSLIDAQRVAALGEFGLRLRDEPVDLLDQRLQVLHRQRDVVHLVGVVHHLHHQRVLFAVEGGIGDRFERPVAGAGLMGDFLGQLLDGLGPRSLQALEQLSGTLPVVVHLGCVVVRRRELAGAGPLVLSGCGTCTTALGSTRVLRKRLDVLEELLKLQRIDGVGPGLVVFSHGQSMFGPQAVFGVDLVLPASQTDDARFFVMDRRIRVRQVAVHEEVGTALDQPAGMREFVPQGYEGILPIEFTHRIAIDIDIQRVTRIPIDFDRGSFATHILKLAGANTGQQLAIAEVFLRALAACELKIGQDRGRSRPFFRVGDIHIPIIARIPIDRMQERFSGRTRMDLRQCRLDLLIKSRTR